MRKTAKEEKRERKRTDIVQHSMNFTPHFPLKAVKSHTLWQGINYTFFLTFRCFWKFLDVPTNNIHSIIAMKCLQDCDLFCFYFFMALKSPRNHYNMFFFFLWNRDLSMKWSLNVQYTELFMQPKLRMYFSFGWILQNTAQVRHLLG